MLDVGVVLLALNSAMSSIVVIVSVILPGFSIKQEKEMNASGARALTQGNGMQSRGGDCGAREGI